MTEAAHRIAAWKLALSAIWMTGFLAWFLIQPLEGTEYRRVDVFLQQLDAWLGVSDSDPAAVEQIPSGLQFLPQRLPAFAAAAVIVLCSACYGKLVLALGRVDQQLAWLERLVLCLGLGLSMQSLVMLGCGLIGTMTRWSVVAPAVAAFGLALAINIRRRQFPLSHRQQSASCGAPGSRRIVTVCVVALIPLAAWILLGACSPPTDFDVLEYHLQGPKEWFQTGRVEYLPHNVYTSFPFLSEMLLLAGMVVTGDWWTGSLAGQIVLSCFQILSSLSLVAIAQRWLRSDVGWLAALICFTTPWTLRISIIPYAEGALTFYLTAATMTALMARNSGTHQRSLLFVTGLLSGSAMATKYTGLVTVIVPVGVLLVTVNWKQRAASRDMHPGHAVTTTRLRQDLGVTFAFGCGVIMAVGPWLLKNTVETGNPVYPLAYSVFGGSEWSDEIEVRWKRAHAPDEHRVNQIPKHMLDFALRNQWTSGLLLAMAVPAMLLWRHSVVRCVLAMCVWQLFAWWAFTHRIDRFWIPVIPLLSLIGAASWTLSSTRGWSVLWFSVLIIGATYGVLFGQLPLVGFHVALADLNAARRQVTRPDILSLNNSLPEGSKVLMVGEAAVFPCTFPLVYNTTFDENLFEQLAAAPGDSSLPPQQRGLLPVQELRARFAEAGITHIYVNWNEILRYRRPGSYGYAEFVQPLRFQQLIDAGLLQPGIPMFLGSWPDLPDSDRAVISSWPGLDRLRSDTNTIVMAELFAVKR